MTLDTENSTSSKTGTFYLAYGSNLSPYQMSRRCRSSPSSSVPIAIVRLDGWKWFICERGYANIAELADERETSGETTVWGVVYNLSESDEKTLDMYEGHNSRRNPYPRINPDPRTLKRNRYLQGNWDYNKHYLPVTVMKWLVADPSEFGISNDGNERITVLVYVDEIRLGEGRIISEYIGRMNRAMDESAKLGIPRQWMEVTMRRWVPPGIYPPTGYVGTDEGYITGEETKVSEMISEETVNGA